MADNRVKSGRPPKAYVEDSAAARPGGESLEAKLRSEGVGGFLSALKKKPADLETDAFLRSSLGATVLSAQGIKQPTVAEVEEATLAVMKAFEAGTLDTFEFKGNGSKLIGGQAGALDNQKNAFFDREYIPNDQLRGWTATVVENPSPGPELSADTGLATAPVVASLEPHATAARADPSYRDPLGPENYENGLAGKLLIGSFVAGPHRWEGGYLRYGEAAWRNFLRAHTYLEDFPRGTFLSKLDINTVKNVNRLATTPEPGASASVFRGLGNLFRGEPAKPGELRNGTQVSRFETFSPQQVATLEKAGIKVHSIVLPTGNLEGWLECPAPTGIPQRLNELIAELKQALGAPTPDVEGAVANFQRAIVALHPFGDGNGRTSRLLANRVLEEFNLPPVIFENQDKDLVSTPEEWKKEVTRGIVRSTKMIRESWKYAYSWDGYLTEATAADQLMGDPKSILASKNHRISLDGLPFDLGKDGLLYSPTGRPHIVFGNQVIPLGQLEYYVIARRLKSMTPESSSKYLAAVSAQTRELYRRKEAGLAQGTTVTVLSEKNAVDADLAFTIKPHPNVAALLIGLMDPALADPGLLLAEYGKATATSRSRQPTSQVMSQYAQRDLEYTLVHDGLKSNGFTQEAQRVMSYRRTLFDLAKKKLEQVTATPLKTPENPHGFTYHSERIMYEHSPLRHGSLDEAIAKDGDDEMVVYRGAYAIEGLVGMAPNNDPRQPSAREIAAFRAERGAVPNLIDALEDITGSAVGAEMICITTDLDFLSHSSFASKLQSHDISLDSLPGFLSKGVMAVVGEELKIDSFGKIKAPVLRVGPQKDKDLYVQLQRAVFVLKVPKKDLLPGQATVGNTSFTDEQEAEGLAKFGYRHVIEAIPQEQLGFITGTASPAASVTVPWLPWKVD